MRKENPGKWFNESQQAFAISKLNDICNYIGCTYCGVKDGVRRCKENHFDCSVLKELTMSK